MIKWESPHAMMMKMADAAIAADASDVLNNLRLKS
jgi:hypothetical protein